MAEIPHIYTDAGLTTLFDDSTDMLDAFALNGESGDGVFYVGVPSATRKIEASSDPGIDPLVVSIADASPASGVESTDIKLALSSAGLGSATAGTSLSIGSVISGGAGNAVAVHYRWSNIVGAGTFTEISLGLSARLESDI